MICVLFSIIFSLWLFKFLTGRRSDSVRCLIGKTAVVTGGNSGIGKATAILLASRGCKVIIADQVDSEETCDFIRKLTQNGKIFYEHLDLSSLKSIRDFAERIKNTQKKIDILINNAGIPSAKYCETADGLNPVMQINYLGPFLLTHLLLDPLKAAASARVIFIGSTAAYFKSMASEDLNDLRSCDKIIGASNVYGYSKMCDILAAQEFGKRLAKYGITVNSADPGLIHTDILRRSKPAILIKIIYFIGPLIARRPLMGAQTIFHLASSEEMDGKTSGHYFCCRPWFKPKALSNTQFCKEIWDKSEELVRLSFEERI